MLTVLGESTPTRGGQGGKIGIHGRKHSHQTTGEEEDLPDLSNIQVLMLQSDSRLPECWQLWDLVPIPYCCGGGGGPGQHCTISPIPL